MQVDYYPFGLKHKGYNNVTTSNGNALGQKYKMFQGQMLDDELNLNWYAFKYRNYDPSLARFHNIDPLAQEYSYQSPYNFSENRVIDGLELEGLEYVSANKARLEIGAVGTLAGKILIKNRNMSSAYQRAYNRANNNPSNWRSGQIGISREIGTVRSISRRPTTRGRNLKTQNFDIKRDIPIAKSTGKPDRRYNPNKKYGSIGGGSLNNGKLSKGLGILGAIDFGFQVNDAVASTIDYFGIDRDLGFIAKAKKNLGNYISESLLADKFNNPEDLSHILNVILQGEVGKGGNIQHMIIGLRIYNKYNNDKKSRNRALFNKDETRKEKKGQ